MFLNDLNKLHNNITFTLETETENSLNFLDLHIERTNNKHSFAMYHKPGTGQLLRLIKVNPSEKLGAVDTLGQLQRLVPAA